MNNWYDWNPIVIEEGDDCDHKDVEEEEELIEFDDLDGRSRFVWLKQLYCLKCNERLT